MSSSRAGEEEVEEMRALALSPVSNFIAKITKVNLKTLAEFVLVHRSEVERHLK